MLFNQILENIGEVIPLSKEEKDYFRSILKFKQVPKRGFLLREGETDSNYYFVISGCLRVFVKNKKNKEQVLQFAPRGWWIADNESILKDKPSKYNIVGALDSEILILTKEAKQESIAKFPRFEKYYSKVLESSIIFLRSQVYEILSQSAEERYKKFCSSFPELIESIPQKYIASYLGLTPEFFSYMKKKINMH